FLRERFEAYKFKALEHMSNSMARTLGRLRPRPNPMFLRATCRRNVRCAKKPRRPKAGPSAFSASSGGRASFIGLRRLVVLFPSAVAQIAAGFLFNRGAWTPDVAAIKERRCHS